MRLPVPAPSKALRTISTFSFDIARPVSRANRCFPCKAGPPLFVQSGGGNLLDGLVAADPGGGHSIVGVPGSAAGVARRSDGCRGEETASGGRQGAAMKIHETDELVVYARRDGSLQINDKRPGSMHDMTVAIRRTGKDQGLTAYPMARKVKQGA